MRQGRSLSMNYWLRARLVAQGVTVAAVVGGTYYYGQSKGQKACSSLHLGAYTFDPIHSSGGESSDSPRTIT
jgi:hypothetical protein